MDKYMSDPVTAAELSTSTVLDIIADPKTAEKYVFTVADPVETQKRIAAHDLAATSLDDLLGGGDVISGKNFVGKPFQLESVEWQPSDIEGEGLPFYAVLHVVDTEGEALVITCGAVSVVRKVAVMVSKGWLPAWVKITKSTSAAGRDVLDLVKAPAAQVASAQREAADTPF